MRALEAAADGQPFVVDGKPNPLIGLLNRTWGMVVRTAAELGLTPSSRRRVHVAAVPVQPPATIRSTPSTTGNDSGARVRVLCGVDGSTHAPDDRAN